MNTINLNLKERQQVVQSLWNTVNEGGSLLKELPRIVRVLINQNAWEEREINGRIVKHKRFVDFIMKPPLEGCGWQPGKVEVLIKDDIETLRLWRDAVTGAKHVHHDSDNITITDDRGTSRSYTVSRLARERPELFDRVVAGKMSANAAAIEAGFRRKPTPFETVSRLWPKLTASEKSTIRGLE